MRDRVHRLNTAAPLVLIILLTAMGYLLSNNASLQRVDHLIYDYMLTWQQHRASDDVVVVAIDDDSLQKVGRWPWSRQTHAELLDRLTSMQPLAVGFDVLFSETQQHPATADTRFAEALRRNGRSVLALAPSHPTGGALITEVLPIPELATAAAGIGHVDIEIDSDGLCRSFFAYAGIGNAHWPAFALKLIDASGHSPRISGYALASADENDAAGWIRDGRFFIPFDPRPDAVKTLSVYRLLHDDTAAKMIKDKYVLVGSTATGLGDVVSTPVSFDHQRMPGVTLNAHILSGLLKGRLSTALKPEQQTAVTLVLTATGAALMVSAGFPAGALLFFAAVIGIIAATGALLVGWQLWFAPAAAIAPLVFGFPLWGAWSLLREKRINKSLTVRMQHQALHHAATDLPNQYMLEQRLATLLASGAIDGRITALMIVHISWSDSAVGIVGHSAGDKLLRAIATRLSGAVRSNDLVAHLSGDDFGILIEHIENPMSADSVSKNLLRTLKQTIDVEGSQVALSPRMGMSLFPTNSPDGASLLRDAYIAMFRARIERATRPCTFSDDIAREVEAHSQLEQALISAMENNEFEVYYQPQISGSNRRLIGVEALLRWQNPELGLVYPGTFIPVAEHNGLIQQIGAWVLRSACLQVQQWNTLGLGPLRLAVNLSPLQFIDGDLLSDVRSALEESGLPAGQLELEITESALMQNMAEATGIMRTLKDIGVTLAIDDFGTGYSSLSHLQHFPLDRIKIDQSFTREITDNVDVREITLTIINMAKRLQLEVIAEGVETGSQVSFLNKNGCDELQGFYFSHPLPSDQLQRMLANPGGVPARQPPASAS